MDGEAGLRVALAGEAHELLVDEVAGLGEGALVVLGGQAAVHDAEVGGAGADVDDHGVEQGLHAVGHRERLGDDHQAVHGVLQGLAHLLLVDPQRLGRHAHHGAHLVAVARLAVHPHQGEQVPEQLAHGGLVLLGAVLDQPLFQRPVEVEHGAVVQRLAADEHGLLQHLARHHVQRPADVALDHEALAVGRRNGAARRPEIDPHLEDLAFFITHESDPFSAAALISGAFSTALA